MPSPAVSNPFTRRVRRLERLRRALAGMLILAAVAVVAVYVFNRRALREEAARRPELKAPLLGVQVQESAGGVTISKSEAGRPVFRVFAQRADKLRDNGLDVLHHVQILVYASDGVHADQIAGDEFGYDEASGDLRARGPVQIDLQSRPGGPAGTAGAIHIDARDLAYNVKQGTGTIVQGVTFSLGTAQGSAGSAELDSHTGRATLGGGVAVRWRRSGRPDIAIASQQGSLQRLATSSPDAMVITLIGQASVASGPQSLRADRLVLYIRHDQSLRHLDALGHLEAADALPGRPLHVSAAEGHTDFAVAGKNEVLSHLVLRGDVVATQSAPGQRDRLSAGQLEFSFTPQHQLAQVQAVQNATLQRDGPAPERLAAPELDFHFVPGTALAAAAPSAVPATAGVVLASIASQGRAALDTIAAGPSHGLTHAEADYLRLELDARQQPRLAVATGDVRVRQTRDAGVRTSQSDRLELRFAAEGSGPAPLQQAIETGRVTLRQDGRQLEADALTYTPATGAAVLTAQSDSAFSGGEVRGSDSQSRFTAPRVDWTTEADGAAELDAGGGVALSFVDTAGAGAAGVPGPMLNASLPVVITAATLHWTQPAGAGGSSLVANSTLASSGFRGIAVFTGAVRLLQAPNLLRADRLTLDASQGTVSASLRASGDVRTEFVANGELAPVASLATPARAPAASAGAHAVSIRAGSLLYLAAEHEAIYQDAVTMRMNDGTLAAPRLVVYLRPGAAPAASGGAAPSGLDHALASGGVHIVQPGRTATAQQVRYDFAQNQVQLEGGPPSILDAEQGRITGDPLTFSLASDEIQVGSKPGVRASGQTIAHK